MSIRSGGAVIEVSEAIKKISLNYLQVVSLAAVFPMKWPPVETFFEIQASFHLLVEHCYHQIVN